MMLAMASEENASNLFRATHARGETFSQWERLDCAGMASMGWTETVSRGFEMWWLAGMPITMVFLFTFLSLSIASGVGKSLSVTVSLRVPELMMRFAAWVLVKWQPRRVKMALEDRARVDHVTVPRHIAIIMDGNRRYGRAKYGSGLRGHPDGSKTLADFTDWCIEAGVEALTVFAFSTENWNRDPVEIDALMAIFKQYMDQIAPDAIAKNIRVRVLVSDDRQLPPFLATAIGQINEDTKHCDGFALNVCVSYGGRDEIVGACRKIATEVANGNATVDDIDEALISKHLLTADLPDPDVLVRTSGELRISNFLLFQIAYAELIFLDKNWPELTRNDLHEHIIKEFSRRKRRFGK